MNILQLPADETKLIRFFDNPISLAKDLADLTGPQFMRVLSRQNMTELNGKGQLKRMNRTGNPWVGKALSKLSIAQVTANFKYAEKVEKRGGVQSATQGNWSQVVLVGNKVTPLSTHKADIVTELTTSKERTVLDDAGNIADCWANRRAVLDDNGDVQFTTDTPRLYLRVEIVRAGGDEPRNERELRSKSLYIDVDGNEVEKSEIEPFLKSIKDRSDETDMQTFSIENVVELRAGGKIYRQRNVDAERALQNWPAQLV